MESRIMKNEFNYCFNNPVTFIKYEEMMGFNFKIVSTSTMFITNSNNDTMYIMNASIKYRETKGFNFVYTLYCAADTYKYATMSNELTDMSPYCI